MTPAILTLLLITPAADYPQAVLKSPSITVTVRMPDASAGFYRGTRFDWSGVIGPVEVFGKKVFLPWKDTHDPANNDDITGPCDEFGMHSPLGFKDAKPGQPFLKIGVGELTKGNDPDYAFWKKYAIEKPGTWSSKVNETDVTFEQSVQTEFGYGYQYSKKLRLVPGEKPTFKLEYQFKNTGTKRITTDVYNHNFFNVAGHPVGPGYEIEFGFPPKAGETKERFTELLEPVGNFYRFKAPLDKGSVYGIVSGYGSTAKDSRITLRQNQALLQLEITGDKPLSKVALWGMKTTICPEPYIAIDLAPGESMAWSWTYAFDRIYVR